MSGEKGAIAGAASAIAAFEPEEPAEQLDLLGLPEPKTAEGRALVADAKRGPGRPPGARNKRTEATVAYLLRQYRDPRAVLLEIAQTRVDVLAASLGCTAKEALQEIRLAAIGALPYVAQRMPLSLDVTDRKIVHLHIDTSDGADGADDLGGIGFTARVIDVVAEHEPDEKPDDGEEPA